MSVYQSTKIIELGSCAFRQWRAVNSHCRYVHGYQLKAKFWFVADNLDEKNWVVDFGGLKDFKKILHDQFDHTVCIAKDDPLIEMFAKLEKAGGCDLRVMDSVGIEKTAEWCFRAAKKYLREATGTRCRISKVEVWEHAENSATFEEDYTFADVIKFN